MESRLVNKDGYLLKLKIIWLTVFAAVTLCMTGVLVSQGYFDSIYFNLYDKIAPACSYCDSREHTVVFCPDKAANNGAIGRWVIPDVGVNVACYKPLSSENAQTITDNRDSAALFSKTDTTYIADHNYQGFNNIKKCKVGTIAYMNTGASMKKYVCVAIIEGYNKGHSLTDIEGNPINFYVDGGYTNYTCNFFKDSVTIVQFAPV